MEISYITIIIILIGCVWKRNKKENKAFIPLIPSNGAKNEEE